MTELQINQQIAKYCGWKFITFDRGWIRVGDGEVNAKIPDYCNDLNAMREAESRFNNSKDADSYIRNLLFETRNLIVGEDSLVLNSWTMYSLVNSTAMQRAKAFLNAINKNK